MIVIKRVGLGLLAAVAVLAVTGLSTPAAAQTCWGSCDDCTSGGHSYGAAGYAAMGSDAHGCGGVKCGESNHTCCAGDCPPPIGPAPEPEQVASSEGTGEVGVSLAGNPELLSGHEIQELIAESKGRYFVNWERRSIQLLACDDPSLVVANVPLSKRQVSELETSVKVSLEE